MTTNVCCGCDVTFTGGIIPIISAGRWAATSAGAFCGESVPPKGDARCSVHEVSASAPTAASLGPSGDGGGLDAKELSRDDHPSGFSGAKSLGVGAPPNQSLSCPSVPGGGVDGRSASPLVLPAAEMGSAIPCVNPSPSTLA